MKITRILALAGFATILAASRLVFISPASAAPTSTSASSKVEKVPGPDFQPPAYFANQRATYQRDKATHPEKYAGAGTKQPEWFFTGKPYDSDSKSYLFLFRNYRPDTASWMTPDPAGFPDGPNNYAYAPMPTCEVDRLGLDAWPPGYGCTYSPHNFTYGEGDFEVDSDGAPWFSGDYLTSNSPQRFYHEVSFGLPGISWGTGGWVVQHIICTYTKTGASGTIFSNNCYQDFYEAFRIDGNGNVGTDTFGIDKIRFHDLQYQSQTSTGYSNCYTDDFIADWISGTYITYDDPATWSTSTNFWTGSGQHATDSAPGFWDGDDAGAYHVFTVTE